MLHHSGIYISLLFIQGSEARNNELARVQYQCAVPDLSLTVMASLRCRICMALPVIKSSLLEHTCCSTVQLCLLPCSLPLRACSCVLCPKSPRSPLRLLPLRLSGSALCLMAGP